MRGGKDFGRSREEVWSLVRGRGLARSRIRGRGKVIVELSEWARERGVKSGGGGENRECEMGRCAKCKISVIHYLHFFLRSVIICLLHVLPIFITVSCTLSKT